MLFLSSRTQQTLNPAQAGLGSLWLRVQPWVILKIGFVCNHSPTRPRSSVGSEAPLHLQLDHVLILEHVIPADHLAGEIRAGTPDLGGFEVLLKILVHLAGKF